MAETRRFSKFQRSASLNDYDEQHCPNRSGGLSPLIADEKGCSISRPTKTPNETLIAIPKKQKLAKFDRVGQVPCFIVFLQV